MIKKQTHVTIEIACSEPMSLMNNPEDVKSWVIEQLGLNSIETVLDFSVEVKIIEEK